MKNLRDWFLELRIWFARHAFFDADSKAQWACLVADDRYEQLIYLEGLRRPERVAEPEPRARSIS